MSPRAGDDRCRTRTSYLEQLAARSAIAGTALCLGLDPDPGALPVGFRPDVGGIERFAALALDAALPHVAAVKPNLAFYEAFGSAGLAALERLRARIPDDVPVVIDAKRGDIGNTAARQAAAIVDGLGADAVTLNPYLGRDALEPFLARGRVFIYALCRTSNPTAGEVQGLRASRDAGRTWPAEPLYTRVARVVATWDSGTHVGLVVGATAPRELAEIREIVPGWAFLVPGVGAQGGDLEAALEAGPARSAPAGGRPGGGLLVNVGRAILGAAGHPDRASERTLHDSIRAAAAEWAARIPVLS
jgi:orotidine-5'-phosphate decarboxylase